MAVIADHRGVPINRLPSFTAIWGCSKWQLRRVRETRRSCHLHLSALISGVYRLIDIQPGTQEYIPNPFFSPILFSSPEEGDQFAAHWAIRGAYVGPFMSDRKASYIAGMSAGVASLLVFLVIHHVWIKPTWSILPVELVIAVPGGLEIGWAYGELLSRLPG
jgi:hypothetical protein